MSSAPHVERFKGTNWEECDDFISAIRARALWEGKQRDSAWIADFAAPLFTRKALSWHCQLPQDVRQDWFKLEVALVKRWPAPENEDDREDKVTPNVPTRSGPPNAAISSQITPTPAAAPPVNRNHEVSRSLQGLLKVVLDQQNTIYYVTMGGKLCTLTTDPSQAIRVRSNSLIGANLLERIDDSSHSWLGVGWNSRNIKIERGCTSYAYMILINPDTMEPSTSVDGPFQRIKFNVLANGEVIPIWLKDDSTEITLFAFVSSTFLYISADAEVYAQKNKLEKRGRFFIEPTE